ncbi:hypothetical protein SMD44_00090 [Streptomyces alboflavus]|uniref:Uncharacterized protein n=1 Tax=Streptomyces alboflavus TaxID=67267 RepID=A0A1Z1W2P6_9ACTN|nr:hypothetical protein [Streptomyces alboflavus]ARX80692.1 hypothetical protein SMD44_00090 [Streptomyces alboflavus]
MARSLSPALTRADQRAASSGVFWVGGETWQARHWFHHITHSMADTTPPDAAFLDGLEIFARNMRGRGSGSVVLSCTRW